MADQTDAKRDLRRQMRAIRRALPDLAERSERLWSCVRQLPAVVNAEIVMLFDSIPGEPETAPFIDWCRAEGKKVVLPEDEPAPDARVVDVVIVPGLAFTAAGERLGQGGGWYDRFLSGIRTECTTIGVGFQPQLVDELPTEPHDVVLDHIITDDGVAAAGQVS